MGFWGIPPLPEKPLIVDALFMASAPATAAIIPNLQTLLDLDSIAEVIAGFYLNNAATIFGVCVVAAVVLEKLIRWATNRDFETQSTLTTLASGGAFLIAKNVVGKALFVGLYAWLYSEYRIVTLDLTNPWVWVGAFLLRDFVYYWVHRAEHQISGLWASHLVHHSPETIGMTTAIRVPWMEALYKPFFGLWLPLIGFNPVAAIAMDVFAALIAQAYHTERFAIGGQGRMGRLVASVFVTPSAHRVHHGYNPEYIDKNFGAVFIFWDRLFGTFAAEVAPVKFGVGASDAVHTPQAALVGGYPRLVTAARSTGTVTGAVTVFMSAPGSPESRGALDHHWRPGARAAERRFGRRECALQRT